MPSFFPTMARGVASPAAADAMLNPGEVGGQRRRWAALCVSWCRVDVSYPEVKHTFMVLGLAFLCWMFKQNGTAEMLLILGAILGSCYADRLGFIRILVGLAVVVGGAYCGYRFCEPYEYDVDKISSAVSLPFVLATLTGTPRIPGDTWVQWASHVRGGGSFLLSLVGTAFFFVAAILGYARQLSISDAFQWGFVALILLAFHIIFNAFRDSAHTVSSEATARPARSNSRQPAQAPAWTAAAAKLPRAEVFEEDLHGSTASSTAVPRCTVCIEEFKAGEIRVTLPCFHGFHPNCVDNWIREHGRCPVCRHSILDNELSDLENR